MTKTIWSQTKESVVVQNNLEGPKSFWTYRRTRHKYIKVRKYRKQYMVSSILPENEQKITILSIFSLGNTLNSDFLFFFGRIEDTIICILLSRLPDLYQDTTFVNIWL
jgi:hypothetical protein